MPVPTQQQSAIINAATDQRLHLIVEARAGTGKTTTLLQLLSKLRGATHLQSFNKSIASELTARVDALPMTERLQLPPVLDISTCHAAGFRAFNRSNPSKARVAGGKLSFIQKDMWKTDSNSGEYFSKQSSTLTRIVSAAKNSGFGLQSAHEKFSDPGDEADWLALLAHFGWDVELESASIALDRAIAHCRKLLAISNAQTTIVDFDDMIYLPLLLNHTLPSYSHVLIDEAQDISATRREMAFRMLAPEGRIIAVGDEYQAIYGFTGADSESLRNISRRAARLGDIQTLPLTTCWRCDSDIIAEAQRFVPDIVARPSADEGTVTRISAAKLIEGLTQGVKADTLQGVADGMDLLPQHGDAILCRLNKPNVALALDLIRAGRRARIEGRDLGHKLLSHVKQADSAYNFKSLAELIVAVEDYGTRSANILAARDRAMSADLLLDEIACAVLMMERCLEQGREDFADLEHEIASMFGDDVSASDTITLSSIHKSKGREWKRVFILGRYDFMPFFRAEQPWELQQEQNLIYVGYTRAEQFLCLITDVQSWLDKRKESR